MKLDTEFIQLPVLFDTERLAAEALQFAEHEWDYHHQDYQGNSDLVLVSPNGEKNNEHCGSMQATAALRQCPYISQVLASFNTVIGRSSLIRLDPGAEMPDHFDINYRWRRRVRIHIPVVTHPDVNFSSCGNIDVHMRAGEAWVFDNWQTHAVQNASEIKQIHLVVDTTGTSDFWAVVARGRDPRTPFSGWEDQLTRIAYRIDAQVELLCERYNQTTVSPPDEIGNMLQDLIEDLAAMRSETPKLYEEFVATTAAFLQDWRSQWMLYGDTNEGLPHYKLLLRELGAAGKALLGNTLLASNSAPAIDVFTHWLYASTDATAIRKRDSHGEASRATVDTSLFDCPIFIVAAPRSGSTMLFELLKENMELWTIGDESHQVFESIKQLHPAAHAFESNALGAEDLTDEVGTALVGSFTRKIRNSRGTLFSQIPPETQGSNLRFLEKTPKNALRIPFIRKLFPNAMFIFLHREAKQNIGSIIDAWNSQNFITYPNLPGWSGPPWSCLLPKGWRDFKGRPLADIAAWQWSSTNRKIIEDLDGIPAGSWHSVSYEDLLNDRERALKRICAFADIPFGPRMQLLAKEQLPHSKYTLSAPAPDKWKRHQVDIESAIDVITDVTEVTEALAKLR